MGLVSATAVVAFDAVGSILVVALMVGPPAAAYLLTDRLPRMIGISVMLGILAAVFGYWAAHFLDASIAGSMASIVGLEFAISIGICALPRTSGIMAPPSSAAVDVCTEHAGHSFASARRSSRGRSRMP